MYYQACESSNSTVQPDLFEEFDVVNNTSSQIQSKMNCPSGVALGLTATLAIVIIIADVMFIAANLSVACIIQITKKSSNLKNNKSLMAEYKASITCILITLLFIVFSLIH